MPKIILSGQAVERAFADDKARAAFDSPPFVRVDPIA